MEIAEAAVRLQENCKLIKAAARFSSVSESQIKSYVGNLPLSSEIIEWFAIAAPIASELDWTANELVLFSPNSLARNQVGYRWIGEINGMRDEKWLESWVVIGAIGGDPVIAHMDSPETPISMAFSGMGDWTPLLVAASLASFLSFLSEWCKLIGSYNGVPNMFDDDFVLTPSALSMIERIIEQELGIDHQQNMLAFMWS